MDSDTTENQTAGDGVKEILAPSEGPRENLINTAIKFLQNPKVMSSPLYQKKAFLEKKGLTQEEIELAVQRAGVVESTAGNQQMQPGQTAVQAYKSGVPGPVPPYYAPIPPQSAWGRARDLTMTTVVVASVSYAVYQLFQKYLRPWLLGKSEQERRMERLEKEIKAIQSSVQESLGQISRTLAAIQTSLAEQRQQSLTSHGELKGISDLKSDISSLKGLMLNKNQFPALPSTAPILPSWQRAPAASTAAATPSPPPSSSSSPLSSKPTSTAVTEANTDQRDTTVAQSNQDDQGEQEEKSSAVDADLDFKTGNSLDSSSQVTALDVTPGSES